MKPETKWMIDCMNHIDACESLDGLREACKVGFEFAHKVETTGEDTQSAECAEIAMDLILLNVNGERK